MNQLCLLFVYLYDTIFDIIFDFIYIKHMYIYIYMKHYTLYTTYHIFLKMVYYIYTYISCKEHRSVYQHEGHLNGFLTTHNGFHMVAAKLQDRFYFKRFYFLVGCSRFETQTRLKYHCKLSGLKLCLSLVIPNKPNAHHDKPV